MHADFDADWPEQDVMAVIDARGGSAYVASLETGLINRCPYANQDDRRRAVKKALASGLVVFTPMGLYRRPPGYPRRRRAPGRCQS